MSSRFTQEIRHKFRIKPLREVEKPISPFKALRYVSGGNLKLLKAELEHISPISIKEKLKIFH
jgi:hypothetical protein